MVAAVGDGGEAGERSLGSSMGQSSLLAEAAFIVMVWVGFDVGACAQGWDGSTDGRTDRQRQRLDERKREERMIPGPDWNRVEDDEGRKKRGGEDGRKEVVEGGGEDDREWTRRKKMKEGNGKGRTEHLIHLTPTHITQ